MVVNRVIITEVPLEVGDLVVDTAFSHYLVVVIEGQYTLLSIEDNKVLTSYTSPSLEVLYKELSGFGAKRVAVGKELQLSYPDRQTEVNIDDK